MAENVELKARLRDPAAALSRALALGAVDQGILTQRDTYFPAAAGRLKLREIEGAEAELIAYRRGDRLDGALSTYLRVPVGAQLRPALEGALGTRVVVAKVRRLLLLENVRIHLDQVEGLGSFVEFEAVLGPGHTREGGEVMLIRLQHELGITDADRVAVGYADLLEQSADMLRAAARQAWQRAYAPYSNFRVGAAIRGASGAIYSAANVENAAYSQAQCAEASAIGVMIAAGETQIAAVAVASEQLEVCTPCGGCRQRLAEFAGPDTPVYLGPEIHTLAALLPMGFSL
jgi:homotetrameric cytidine deaminase